MFTSPPSRHRVALLLLCLALWGWTCGLWDLWGADECRYVQVARELQGRSNWFYLTVHGQPYDQKPPLLFWMLAVAIQLCHGRLVEWALRLPSVLLATLAVLLTYEIGRRRFNPRMGLLSALVLLCTPLFIVHAPSARLDVVYAGWTAIALAAWLWSEPGARWSWVRTALFWIGIAGAFLVKGPPCFIVIACVVLVDLVRSRGRGTMSALQWMAGALVLAAVILGWLEMEKRVYGSAFVQGQVVGQTVERFMSGSHEKPIYYYLLRIPLDIFFPWSIFLGLTLWSLWRERAALWPRLASLVAWGLLPVIFFSLASGKRQMYLMPLLPGMALLVGWYLDARFLARARYPRWSRALAGLCAVVALVVVVGTAWVATHRARMAAEPFDIAWWDMAVWCSFAALLVAAAMVLFSPRTNSARLLAVLFALMLTGALAYYVSVNPARDPRKSTRAFSAELGRRIAEHGLPPVVGALGQGDKPEFHVYAAYRVIPLPDEALEKQPRSLPGVLLGREKDVKDLADRLARAGYRRLYATQASSDPIVVYLREAPGAAPAMH